MGFAIGGLAKAAEHEEDKEQQKVQQKAEAKKEDEATKVEMWGDKGVQFVSVPRAVMKANEAARTLLKDEEDVRKFARFCREDLERELRLAELTSAVIRENDSSSWISNDHIVGTLEKAIYNEGFIIEKDKFYSDRNRARITISLIGKRP